MFPFSTGYADPSVGYNGLKDCERILQRANRKNGGVTSTWKVVTAIKTIAQKRHVADIISIKPTRSSGVQVLLPHNLDVRCGGADKYLALIDELVDTAEDCGYKVCVGDGYLELVPVE